MRRIKKSKKSGRASKPRASRPNPQDPDQESYALRSLFFHRKVKELAFPHMREEIKALKSAAFNWGNLKKLGIQPAGFASLEKQGIDPIHIFCHPEVIRTNPRLVAFYRGVAGISHKGMGRTLFPTFALELGKGKLDEQRAARLASHLNSLISAQIEADPEYGCRTALSMLFATFGDTVGGSWRNLKGDRAAIVARSIIHESFRPSEIETVTLHDGTALVQAKQTPVEKMRAIELRNGYHIRFGSEPDVAIYDSRSVLIGTIEIKGGTDRAGALERYAAALKSFEHAITQNPRVLNYYLASCSTPAVDNRIQKDRKVHEAFDLHAISLEPTQRERFVKALRWLCRL